jgi:hypothetical protein
VRDSRKTTEAEKKAKLVLFFVRYNLINITVDWPAGYTVPIATPDSLGIVVGIVRTGSTAVAIWSWRAQVPSA